MANPISLTSPLPPEDLFFEAMTVSAALSSLGDMQLSLLSPKPDLKAQDLLGQAVTVHVDLNNGQRRHFNGLITQFGVGAHKGRYFGYQATVRPWLWFLTRTSDCRVFQDLTVPDIVKKVFGDHPIANFDFKLFRQYPRRTYCVQYRESDFNFVARLLEHEGIYWYFEHREGQHKLVLVDAQGAHDAAAGYESLRYIEDPAHVPPGQEFISNWAAQQVVSTGKVALTSYDFERPAAALGADKAQTRSYDLSDYEGFDFQGDYTVLADGKQWAENRLDEVQTQFHESHGGSNAAGLAVGCTFSLSHHPGNSQNTEYLITAISIQAKVGVFASDGGAGNFLCNLQAIPSAQQFRPPRRTPRPFVQGPQSAVVVGPPGEEVFTDKYGRVKVHFHWDRAGPKTDKGSCWVRASHPWAGKNFGAIHIPRVGQEVIVDFLEGDPDQPIIIGRVYNAEQMPPWELPANATQTGILTRSSKGGSYGNANAIRFEDKKGSEQLWIHAEKNQDIEVENDETHGVGHDRRKTIDHDETVHVKHDRTETVDNNETIAVGANRSVSVSKDETKSVTLKRSHSVGKDESIAIGAAQDVTIGTNQTISVAADQSTSVGANRSIELGKDLSTTVGKNETRTVGEERQTSIGKDDKLQVGKKFYLEAADEITLKTGDASITMKKDGTIQIKGKDITVTGSGKIGIKASGDMVLKGAKIAQN